MVVSDGLLARLYVFGSDLLAIVNGFHTVFNSYIACHYLKDSNT